MMNLGPPPPPPPPPFSTGAPVAPAPTPKPPSEVLQRAAPVTQAPPAALAGAMLKDKKPFTYTPGGINLAEIKSPRMQRRLQRNASLEGVRPSPLAQQPPPSPPGHSATLPPHGMIQVLPVPGMAMAPVKKPQPKEPPKPKKNVCGPAPPPPPFMISGESSIEPSPSATPPSATPPSATPLTTPASTPAVNSATPPSTPSAFSTLSTTSNSSNPVVNGLQQSESDNYSTSNEKSNLQPVMATEPGPSIPAPPPPPPPCVATRKKFSIPSSSCPPSSPLSKPETEGFQSPVSTISSPPLTKPPITPTETEPVEVLNSCQAQETVPDSIPPKLDEPSASSSELLSPAQNHVNSTTETSPSKSLENEKENVKSPTPEFKKENKDQPIDECAQKSEMSNSLQHHDTAAEVPKVENDNVVPVVNDTPKPKKEDDTDMKQIEKSNDVKTVPEIIPTQTSENVPISEKIQTNRTTPPKPTSFSPVSFPKMNNQSENKSLENLPSKPSFKTSESTVAPTPVRPMARMASPPAIVQKDNRYASNDRFIRQASLPADPTSPPISKPINKGSLYIAPVKIAATTPGGNSKTSSPIISNTGSSPTSGLVKAPLPWMCGIKKDTTPPPEFLTQAQKSQERLHRQRSLPQQDNRKQFFEPQKTEPLISSFSPPSSFSQPGFPNSSPADAVHVTSPPQVHQSPQHTWRSPANQGNLSGPQYRQPLQQPQEQMQKQFQQQQQQLRQQPQGQYQQQQFQQPRQQFQQPRQQFQQPQQQFQQPQQQFQQPQQQFQQPQQQFQQPQQQFQQPQQQFQRPQKQFQQPQQQPYSMQNNQQHPLSPPTQPQHFNQPINHPGFSQTISQQNHPRERIIPIMLEDCPPVNQNSFGQTSKGGNFMAPKNQGYQPSPQRQNSWQQSSSVPSSPMGSGGAFAPYESQEKHQSSSNALEALQQMQQNLAQLNSGLQTAQSQPSQNGGSASAPMTHFSAGPDPAMQSRSFKVIQSAYDTPDNAGRPSQEAPPEPKKYTGSNIPSRSFRMLQAMTDTDDGPGPGESDL